MAIVGRRVILVYFVPCVRILMFVLLWMHTQWSASPADRKPEECFLKTRLSEQNREKERQRQTTSFRFIGDPEQSLFKFTAVWWEPQQCEASLNNSAYTCVLPCDSFSYEKQHFREHDTKWKHKKNKKGEKEGADFIKDPKQKGTNHNTQVQNENQ